MAHTNFTSTPDFAGNVAIGANSNVTGGGEFFKGQMEFMRVAQAPRYRGTGLQPITNPPILPQLSPLGKQSPHLINYQSVFLLMQRFQL